MSLTEMIYFMLFTALCLLLTGVVLMVMKLIGKLKWSWPYVLLAEFLLIGHGCLLFCLANEIVSSI